MIYTKTLVKSSRGFTNDQMAWCCDQSNTSDEEAYIEQGETGDIWKLNCNPERKNISDSDIKEWNIELRENDLTLEEQNVIKREIAIKRRSLEETRKNKTTRREDGGSDSGSNCDATNAVAL